MDRRIAAVWLALVSTAWGWPLGSNTTSATPSLIVERTGDVFSLYLDGGDLNDGFETLSLQLKPTDGGYFLSPAYSTYNGATPYGPGAPATFLSRMIDNPRDEGDNPTAGSIVSLGKELTDQSAGINTAILGSTFNTSRYADSRIFLANIMPSAGFEASLELLRSGDYVAHMTATAGLYQPTLTQNIPIEPKVVQEVTPPPVINMPNPFAPPEIIPEVPFIDEPVVTVPITDVPIDPVVDVPVIDEPTAEIIDPLPSVLDVINAVDVINAIDYQPLEVSLYVDGVLRPMYYSRLDALIDWSTDGVIGLNDLDRQRPLQPINVDLGATAQLSGDLAEGINDDGVSYAATQLMHFVAAASTQSLSLQGGSLSIVRLSAGSDLQSVPEPASALLALLAASAISRCERLRRRA